jgi:ABC-type polysaccharide/polyol phosphate export permease
MDIAIYNPMYHYLLDFRIKLLNEELLELEEAVKNTRMMIVIRIENRY